MTAPRPPNSDLIVLGSVKNDNDGQYLSAVIHTSDNSVDYVNPGTRQLVNGAVWSPDGGRAYLSATDLDSSTGSVVTFTPPQGFTTTPMPTGVTPKQVAIDGGGSRLYLPSGGPSGGSFEVLDTSSLTSVLSIPFETPTGVGAPVYSPDGKVFIPPGPQGLSGSLPYYDVRGAIGESLVGGNSPVVGALAADLPSAIRVVSGQKQAMYLGRTIVDPVVVSVVDPAGHPLPDQLVRFTDDDAGAHFQDCNICLTYTGPDGTVASPPIVAEGTAGPAHVLALVDQVGTATIPLTVLPPAVPPTVTALTAGDGQVGVAFTPGDDRGISPPTGFTVTATDVTNPAHGGQTATGSGSPITVTGLTNGESYRFTVTANTPEGDWVSAPSAQINVGIPASITGTPPSGTVGVPYRFTFTVAGVPTPTVTLNAGTPLPDGLVFDAATATISGTPAADAVGPAFVLITAVNAVGSAEATPTIVINPAESAEEPQPTPTPTTPTTSASASPSVTGSGSPPPGGRAAVAARPLASTGMPVDRLLGGSALLLVLGGALVLLSRRRRTAVR
jgi:hypothetical protein